VDAFHAFLAGRFFSRVGDKIFLLALPLLIQGMGYGAALLSFANAVQYVANWAGAPLGGYLTERHSRKTIMLAVHTAQAAAILGVIASLSMRSFFPFVLVLSIFFLHLASMVNRVNRFSLTPLLRQRNQIPHANAEIQLMESAARLVGPWVAGIVMVHLRLRAALGLDLLSFLIMAMVVWVALRLPVNERNGARSAAARARDLWRWRFEGPDGVRRVLLVNGFVNAAFTFISGFNVFLMSSAHHLSVMVISWILTATAAASLLFGLSLRANLAHVAEPSLTKMRLALAVRYRNGWTPVCPQCRTLLGRVCCVYSRHGVVSGAGADMAPDAPGRVRTESGLCRDIARAERHHAGLDGGGWVPLASAWALVAAVGVRRMCTCWIPQFVGFYALGE